MSTSFRAFLIVSFLALTYYTLHPSLMYYFYTDPKIRAIAEKSEEDRQKLQLSPEESTALKLAEEYRENTIKLGLDLKGGLNITLQADFEKMAALTGKPLSDITEEQKQDALNRIITQIQNRIDTAGVSEIIIRKQENYRINIQLPGESSSKRIENIVSTTGNLALKFVNEKITEALDYDAEEDSIKNRKLYDPDYQIAFLYERNSLTGKREKSLPLALDKKILLTGEHIIESSAAYGEFNQPIVTFSLDLSGAKEFGSITARENVGKRMAILLDGNIMSTPVIRVPILDGNVQIEGNFTVTEARDLALILKSGSLPVPIKFISKQIIGPKLGKELRDRSFSALLFAMLLVVAFMLFRYRIGGAVASLALLLNGIMIIAFLSSFGLTISLSGVAGLILTAGIAIDANVIIFERIKEETYGNHNQPLAVGVFNGYDRAFWSIFDSNVTTLIAAFVLFYYGAGSLQGFATTLFVGIIISMFTALFFTRFIFDLLLNTKIKNIPPRWLV